METSEPSKRLELILWYWIRESVIESPISKEVVQLINEQVKIGTFEWDPNRKGQFIVLSDDNRAMEHHGNWDIVLSQNVLDGTKWRWAFFELTLQEINENDKYLKVGFVDSTIVDQMKYNGNHSMYFLGRQPKDC